jgi:uncharacterized membrane protein YhaH (DUF805 family)
MSSSQLPVPADDAEGGWPYLLRLWFGVKEPVHQKEYILSGFGLMLLKYGVEAYFTWVYTATFLSPLGFLNPSMNSRAAILHTAPGWLPWIFFLWTLPFLWIAITMSVRRMADCGTSPWQGLLVLVPLINLLVMLGLCLAPSKPGITWAPVERTPSDAERALNATFAIGLSVVIGGVMLFISVYLFSTYGASLFLGTPMLMSTTASYLYNNKHPRPYFASIGVGLSSVFFALCALLLFAL